MPSLRDIRRRITSVKNMQKITRAMKMVSAAKLRRAQEAILKARPYAEILERALGEVAARAGGEGEAAPPAHPLLAQRPAHKVELVLLTSDRGLAGGFNANINRRALRYVYENQASQEIRLSTIGRKARDYFRMQKLAMRRDYAGTFADLRFERAQAIAEELTGLFLSGDVDRIHLVYNEFKSAIAQKVVMRQLLPIETAPQPAAAAGAGRADVDFLYEPGREKLLKDLLPRHVAIQVWRALLESTASEHGARMTAMESASKNAGEMILSLTLQANRARQAYITKELMEIVSGAEALR